MQTVSIKYIKNVDNKILDVSIMILVNFSLNTISSLFHFIGVPLLLFYKWLKMMNTKLVYLFEKFNWFLFTFHLGI